MAYYRKKSAQFDARERLREVGTVAGTIAEKIIGFICPK